MSLLKIRTTKKVTITAALEEVNRDFDGPVCSIPQGSC